MYNKVNHVQRSASEWVSGGWDNYSSEFASDKNSHISKLSVFYLAFVYLCVLSQTIKFSSTVEAQRRRIALSHYEYPHLSTLNHCNRILENISIIN